MSLVKVSKIISQIKCRWGPDVGSPLETGRGNLLEAEGC